MGRIFDCLSVMVRKGVAGYILRHYNRLEICNINSTSACCLKVIDSYVTLCLVNDKSTTENHVAVEQFLSSTYISLNIFSVNHKY